jgi:hypothetical protein
VQTCAWLFIAGVFTEFVGIVLLGFPDLLPGARRLSGWLRRQENRVRRLVGLPTRRGVVYAKSGTLTVGVGASSAGMVSTSATTLEGKVEYLMRRDQDSQRAENALAARVNRLEAESPQQIAKAQRQMEQHVAAKLADARAEYHELRVAGTGALALGLILVTVATFIA